MSAKEDPSCVTVGTSASLRSQLLREGGGGGVKWNKLPDDMWGEVFSFFCEDVAIANLLLLSKTLMKIVHHYTNVSVHIGRYQIDEWASVFSWLGKFQRLGLLRISSSNCKSSALRPIIHHLKTLNNMPSLSVAKCFAITDDVIQDMSGVKNISLCDIDVKRPVPQSFFSNLCVLILSNNTFGEGSLKNLFGHFPSTLTVLAFGGCKHLNLSYQPTQTPASLRDNIFVEVTFLDDNDRSFLEVIFPHATFLDFTKDSVDTLDTAFKRMNAVEKRLNSDMLSCNNVTNSTPLHIACRDADFHRCKWLLARHARHDLKDYKGCTPLHRAVEAASQLDKAFASRHLVKNVEDRTNVNTMSPLVVDDSSSFHPPLATFLVNLRNDALPEPVWPPIDTLRFNAWQCTTSCLQAGASCFVRNQNYETPLYVAALRGDQAILYTMVSHLLKTTAVTTHPANSSSPSDTAGGTPEDYLFIDEKSSDLREFSPLHAAILSKSLYCINLLLLAGCSPNKQNKFGSTAMHLAYRSNVTAIIAMITSAGGSLEIKDASGDSPLLYSPAAARDARFKSKKHHKHSNKTKQKRPVKSINV